MKKLCAILLMSFVYGCTVNAPSQPVERTVYIAVPLSLPNKPQFPKISASAMECISDETKNKLLQRDVLIKNYILELETIILSTKNKTKVQL